MTTGWPVVTVRGDAERRGVSYGIQARHRIAGSVALYRSSFAAQSGLTWAEARERASGFAPAVEAYDAELLPELSGIAEGAGLDLGDILALNVRTEMLFGRGGPVAECTSLAALPEATVDRTTLVAQNWDWLLGARDTCVLLVAEPDDRPPFATLVEAGLLAKAGLNRAGIGLATNALASDADRGEPGVPYHAILRRILTSETLDEAVRAVTDADRASSGNYLVADADGGMVDVEATPESAMVLSDRSGVYAHANHLTAAGEIGDRGPELWPSTTARAGRALGGLVRRRGALDVAGLHEVLTDHVGHPDSVCAHPDPFAADADREGTVASIVLDLAARRLWATVGPPCQQRHEPYDLDGLLEGDRRELAAAGAGSTAPAHAPHTRS